MRKHSHHIEPDRHCNWCVSYEGVSAGCVDLSFNILDQKVYDVLVKLSELTTAKLKWLMYKYPVNIERVTVANLNLVISEVSFIYNTLTSELNARLRGFKGCLSDKELQTVVEKANGWTGGSYGSFRRDYTVDSTGLDQWIAKNPKCLSYEAWNKWASWMCDNIQLDVKIEQKKCDIVFDIVTRVIPCELLADFKIDKGNKGSSGDECKMKFDMLLDTSPKCNLNLALYKELVACDFSFSLIQKVYDCNLKFVKKKKEWEIQTPNGTYPASAFTKGMDLDFLYSVVSDT